MREQTRRLVDAYGTQAKLADALGQSQQRVSKVVSDRDPAGVGFARAVADLLGLSLDELLSGKTSGELPRLGDHPDWQTASQGACEMEPSMAERITALSAIRSPHLPARLTPDRVILLAQIWGNPATNP